MKKFVVKINRSVNQIGTFVVEAKTFLDAENIAKTEAENLSDSEWCDIDFTPSVEMTAMSCRYLEEPI